MHLTFEKIVIDNFLSIGHAEINLLNRGYTLIQGINKNPKDSAESNGSGKTSLLSAICYALTGETLSGNKDVKNLFTDEGTSVLLTFTADENRFEIRRTKDHSQYKTDLKLYVNGLDKSGKGVRDSQKILEQYLPDITTQFIGSVILLGQGMPQRFTNNTPSGRKEILENLSKSDFMIDDLKLRISNRKSKLSSDLRDNEDEEIKLETQVELLNSKIDEAESRITTLGNSDSIIETINSHKVKIDDLQHAISNKRNLIDTLYVELNRNSSTKTLAEEEIQRRTESTRQKFSTEKDALVNKLSKLKLEKQSAISEIQYKINDCTNEKKHLEDTIRQIESITDICPTCGRKLDNVIKSDTTKHRTQLSNITAQITTLNQQKVEIEQQFNNSLQLVENEISTVECRCNAVIADTTKELKANLEYLIHRISDIDAESKELSKSLVDLENQLSEENTKLTKAEASLDLLDSQINNLMLEIKKDTDIINQAKEKLENIIKENEVIEKRLSIISKFNTIVTRDFRGYLLSNVINYIDKKAKDYCEDVFGNREIEFLLDGNNLDIRYCGKLFESLSGGESQKINLIIQLAIRNMLCQFLDFRCNLIGIDECFDFLDSLGCERVLDLISKRLTDIDTIFIISHHTELGIPSDSTIIVVKDANGISSIHEGE